MINVCYVVWSSVYTQGLVLYIGYEIRKFYRITYSSIEHCCELSISSFPSISFAQLTSGRPRFTG